RQHHDRGAAPVRRRYRRDRQRFLRAAEKVSPRCVRVLPDRQTWHTGSMRQCIAGSPGVSSLSWEGVMPKSTTLLSLRLICVARIAAIISLAAAGPAAAEEIKVIEHATTDAVTDTGAQGDSAGDILTFANEVFDADDKNKVGSDQGICFRTVSGKAWECFWALNTDKGQIT